MLLIYTPEITPRIEYVFDMVFKNELGIEYSITTYRHRFEGYSQEKLNYSTGRVGNELFVKSSGLLGEKRIEKKVVPLSRQEDIAVLFPGDDDLGFDIFSAVFYMVSRYEEYLPFTPDTHGRFTPKDSLAFQYDFLQYPVVNNWILIFRKILSEKFPSLVFSDRDFKSIFTYDIDIAYAFRGRNRLRTAGSVLKDVALLNLKNISRRIATSRTEKDPWDIYDNLGSTIKEKELKTIFFFLLADYAVYDRNLPWDEPLMEELIKKITAFSPVGIHPSYRSSEIPGKIETEKNRLEKLSGKKITKSRQHYLRFKMPGTYRDLIKAGITEDHSMGFADMPGFRAGTCTPFYFYDLEKERATTLKIFPVTCMDATFYYNLKLSPAKSIDIILALIKEVKKVNGVFISIWHNNIISDTGPFKGWKSVHAEVINSTSMVTSL
jgi:hypothetical protein